MTNDPKTPKTDDTLFSVSDFEESYFVEKTNAKYAVKIENDSVKMENNAQTSIVRNMGRYRKLTPRECLRLMGFDDSFKIVVSDTATYKQAGNSIIVNVLVALLKQIDITLYGHTQYDLEDLSNAKSRSFVADETKLDYKY